MPLTYIVTIATTTGAGETAMKQRAHMWNWIVHPDQPRVRLANIGIEKDGATLHNPNGYPEELVRRAVAGALARAEDKRKASTAKGVATRKRRRENKVKQIAHAFLKGEGIEPQSRCALCKKKLQTAEAVQRGVGAECWHFIVSVMDEISSQKAAA